MSGLVWSRTMDRDEATFRRHLVLCVRNLSVRVELPVSKFLQDAERFGGGLCGPEPRIAFMAMRVPIGIEVFTILYN